jgi:hypothetical protein
VTKPIIIRIIFHSLLNTIEFHTCVNGGAAAKEGVGPWLSISSTLGIDSFTGVAQNVVEAILPVLDISVIYGTSAVGSGWSSSRSSNWSLTIWGLFHWGRHVDQKKVKMRY